MSLSEPKHSLIELIKDLIRSFYVLKGSANHIFYCTLVSFVFASTLLQPTKLCPNKSSHESTSQLTR